MDLRKIKTLIDLVQESGIAELEVKEGEESVRISRHSTGRPVCCPKTASAMPMRYPPSRFASQVPGGMSGKSALNAVPKPQRNIAPSEAPIEMANSERIMALPPGC